MKRKVKLLSDHDVKEVCSVMVSKTGPDRYFVADGQLAPWCDEIGGLWLKVEYPNVPTRAEQKSIAGAVSPEPTKEKENK